jgi:hypothetical protein
LTGQITTSKKKVMTLKRCISLLLQTIKLLQDTNEVIKAKQISGKYKICMCLERHK